MNYKIRTKDLKRLYFRYKDRVFKMSLMDYASPAVRERIFDREVSIPILVARSRVLGLEEREVARYYGDQAEASSGLKRLYFRYKETSAKRDYVRYLREIERFLGGSGLVKQLMLHFLDIAKEEGARIPIAVTRKMDRLPRTDFSDEREVGSLFERYNSRN
mgnify:FL=1